MNQDSDRYSDITLIAVAIFAQYPLIQLGYAYYLSFQLLAFALLVRALPVSAYVHELHRGLLLLALMVASNLQFLQSKYLARNVLFAGREWLCLFVLLCVMQAVRQRTFAINSRVLSRTLVILVALLVASVAIQFVMLARGVVLIVPPDWFILNAEMLDLDLNLIHGIAIRPTSFFGEPSYASFILFSLAVVVLETMKGGKTRVACLTAITVAVALCQSLSGMVSMAMLLAFHAFRQVSWARLSRVAIAFALFILGVMLLDYSGFISVFERASEILDSNAEASGYFRIVSSFLAAKTVFQKLYILGVPVEELDTLLSGTDIYITSLSGGFDNAFFNVIIRYGLTSIVIFWALLKAVPSRMLLFYVVASSMFNGSLFAFDKVAVIGITILCVFAVQSTRPSIQYAGGRAFSSRRWSPRLP